MNREVHVRFCEGVGVKFPRATRPLIYTRLEFNLAQDIESISKWSSYVQRISRLSPAASGGAFFMDSLTTCIRFG